MIPLSDRTRTVFKLFAYLTKAKLLFIPSMDKEAHACSICIPTLSNALPVFLYTS
jgi:hypothetical protein